MWLSLVVLSGLGSTAHCFLEHADLLEYAGAEKKTAGEGEDRAGDGAGGPLHFTSEHQAHSAGPEGPDEPGQQSGIYSLLFEIHPPLANIKHQESNTKTSLIKICFAFLDR